MNTSIQIRIVIQRSSLSEVKIGNISQGQLQKGLVLFFGVGFSHSQEITTVMKENFYKIESENILKQIELKIIKTAEKVLSLRIFSDENDKMNLNVKDVTGGIYIISQFTLFADCSKGNRPSFNTALKPDIANAIYEKFILILKEKYLNGNIYTGKFGEDMQVTLCNDGPVTIILDEHCNIKE